MTDEEIKYILAGDFYFDIPNFEKWNPPILSKKTGEECKRSWFKIDAHWNDDRKFWKLPPLARELWLELVTLRAQGCNKSIINVRLITMKCHFRASSLYKLLPILLKLQLIVLQRDKIREREGKNKEPLLQKHELLSEENIAFLTKQFGEKLLKKRLKDAVFHWHGRDVFFKSKNHPLTTIQRYLIIERTNEEKREKDQKTNLDVDAARLDLYARVTGEAAK